MTPLHQVLDVLQNIQHAALVFATLCGLPANQTPGVHAACSLRVRNARDGAGVTRIASFSPPATSPAPMFVRRIMTALPVFPRSAPAASAILTAARRVSAVKARMCKSREQFAPRLGDSDYSYMDFSLNLFKESSDVFKHGRARRQQNAEQAAHKTREVPL